MRHSHWSCWPSHLQHSSGCGIGCREGSCPPGARASRPHPLPSDTSAAFGLAPEGRCCRRLRGSTLVRADSMGLRCRSQGDVAFVAERAGPKAPPASPARRSAAAASRLDSIPRTDSRGRSTPSALLRRWRPGVNIGTPSVMAPPRRRRIWCAFPGPNSFPKTRH